MNEKFKIGDKVTSRAIGACPAFTGTVVASFNEEVYKVDMKRKVKVGGYYHIEDQEGKLWHREDYDLKEVLHIPQEENVRS